MKKNYTSLEEYCIQNPNRNKRFDSLIRYTINKLELVNIIEIKPRDNKDVKQFILKLEQAHRNAKNSKLIFKLQIA